MGRLMVHVLGGDSSRLRAFAMRAIDDGEDEACKLMCRRGRMVG